MEKTYRSKVDIWLLAVIYAVIIASVVPIGCSGNVAVSIIIATVLIVPITFYLFNIRYGIRGTSLIVKDGLFSHAYDINDIQLKLLHGGPTRFRGNLQGEFPESGLPPPMELYLKTGAQIIFIKNDIEHQWVNGTLGTIIGFDEDDDAKIYVRTENGQDVMVELGAWSKRRYHINGVEKKMEEEEIGRYEQYPLRLAWAITVHKSQGLTFNQVKIDFTGGVFAGGQTYVALSRCTSLEGISLQEPIRQNEVFVRNEVKQFARHYNDQSTINTALTQSKADKQYHDWLVYKSPRPRDGVPSLMR